MKPEHYIGFLFCIIPGIHYSLFWYFEWKAVYDGLRGKDKLWQAIEIIAHVVIVIWPCMLMADTFFGFHASDNAWESVNIVIAVAVLGISYKQYLQAQQPKQPERKEKLPDHEIPEGQ